MLAFDTASTTERPHTQRNDHKTAIAMAELFISNARRSYVTTLEDLKADGFSDTEISIHTAAARRIARDTMATRDVADDNAEYSRDERIDKAAHLVAGMITAGEGQIFTTLRQNGFPTRELGQLYPDIITRSCQLILEQRTAAEAH